MKECSVCAGVGSPISGLKCICGGLGTADAEMYGLRITVVGLEKLNKDMADQLLIANTDLVNMTNCHANECRRHADTIIKFNAAKAYIEASPCDPGITTKQIDAYAKYKELCNES